MTPGELFPMGPAFGHARPGERILTAEVPHRWFECRGCDIAFPEITRLVAGTLPVTAIWCNGIPITRCPWCSGEIK